MANLRPWRKLKLQVFVTDKWNDHVEDQPDGALPQVGGHGAWDKEQAIQVNKKGLVLKPVQENKRGEREVQFFQTVASSTDPAVKVFADFIPEFHGVSKKMKNGKEKSFLMMENLTNNFSKACIMDIKIGTRTWGPDASPEKQAQQDNSYRGTKVPFGFSVPGLSAYRGADKEEVVVKDKEFGKMLTVDNIDQVLELFLDISTDRDLARILAKMFIEKLRKVEALFQTQTTYNFYASSLLFVYDAEGAKKSKDLGSEKLQEFVNVKMIDFAHVWPAEEGKIDQNYLKGVQSLIKLFSNV